MRYFTLFTLFIFPIFLLHCTKEDNGTISTIDDLENFIVTSSEIKSSAYFVSLDLLNKYICITSKKKNVASIKPIAKDNEILAYYVLFEDDLGWMLISADTRVSPVLSYSDSGILDLENTASPAVRAVWGMLDIVKEAKIENNSMEHSIWSFLSGTFKYRDKKNTKKAKIDTRAGNGGMWIALDTIFVNSSYHSPRLTSTSWGLYSPWNTYAPYDLDLYNHENISIQCPVGCAAVATGQLFYKYVSTNIGTDTIPTQAEFIIPNTIIFGQYATTGWANLSIDTTSNSSSLNQTAIFLSWLGHRMGLEYLYNGTSLYSYNITNMETIMGDYLHYTKGEYSLSNNSNTYIKQYFCDTVLFSMSNGSPIMILGTINYTQGGHVFIIDKYETDLTGVLVHYFFDNSYTYSEEEYLNLPAWRFIAPNGGKEEDFYTEEYIDLSDRAFININWGLAEYGERYHYNNYFYLLKNVSLHYDTPIAYNYYISWALQGEPLAYNTVNYWYYNFSRKINN